MSDNDQRVESHLRGNYTIVVVPQEGSSILEQEGKDGEKRKERGKRKGEEEPV